MNTRFYLQNLLLHGKSINTICSSCLFSYISQSFSQSPSSQMTWAHCITVLQCVCVYTEYSWKPKIYISTCSHFFRPLQLISSPKIYSKNLCAKITRIHLGFSYKKKCCSTAHAVSSATLWQPWIFPRLLYLGVPCDSLDSFLSFWRCFSSFL